MLVLKFLRFIHGQRGRYPSGLVFNVFPDDDPLPITASVLLVERNLLVQDGDPDFPTWRRRVFGRGARQIIAAYPGLKPYAIPGTVSW